MDFRNLSSNRIAQYQKANRILVHNFFSSIEQPEFAPITKLVLGNSNINEDLVKRDVSAIFEILLVIICESISRFMNSLDSFKFHSCMANWIVISFSSTDVFKWDEIWKLTKWKGIIFLFFFLNEVNFSNWSHSFDKCVTQTYFLFLHEFSRY